MASFTDQLVAFNPYIPQVPVDDYVRVGLAKQAQYNQGVEKTQQYIDSIAGMEVIKDVHKDYLKKRVNQLSGEVSKIVSEDFSNQQLVNSVGHLTAQIGSDPILQTAQLSTQKYKQGMSDMKRAQQEGKSAPSNEHYFQKQVNNWLSDGDINTEFSASYVPHTDVDKKIMGVIKELHPDSTLEDIPYVRGADGKIKLTNGMPEIDFAMMRKEIKGLDPEKIKMAIKANLDSNDTRQLQIDGIYEYRNTDAKGMKTIADESYTNRLNTINDTIQGLLVDRQTNIGDQQHVQKVDAQIEALKTAAQKYQQSYRRDINYLDKDLDGFKGSQYMENWLSRFGEGFAYAEHSLKYESNPYFQAAELKRQNDIKFQEFLVNKQLEQQKIGISLQELGLKREQLEINRSLAEAKIRKLGGGAGGDSPLDLTGAAIGEGIGQEELEKINADNFVSQTEQESKDAETQKMALLADLRPDLVDVVRNPDGKGKRYEYKVKDKDPNKVISEAEASLLKVKESYDKGEKVPDAFKTYFVSQANANQDIANRKTAINKLSDTSKETWNLKPLLNKYNNLRATSGSGTEYVFTPEEVMDFNNKFSKSNIVKSSSGGTGGGGAPYIDNAEAHRIFTSPKERFLYGIYQKKLENKQIGSGDKTIIDYIDNIHRNVNLAADKIIKGRDIYMDNAVRDIVTATQPTGFTIESFKTEDKGGALATISQLYTSIVTEGKGNESPYWDKSDIRKMLTGSDSKLTSFTLEAKGNDKFAIGIHNPEFSGKRREMEITKAQAAQLFGGGAMLDDFMYIRRALQLSKGSGKVTTDVQGTGINSAFTLNNGLIKNYGVKYHVEDPLKNGSLQIRLYIYDREGDKKWHETTARYGDLLNEVQVTQALASMPDSYIDQILDKK